MRKITGKAVSLALSFALVTSCFSSTAIAAGTPQEDMESQLGVMEQIEPQYGEFGGITAPFDVSNTRETNRKARGRAALPKKMNLVKDSRVTPASRNQARWGTCWAFGSLGSAESSLYPSVKDSGFEFSERHLAYFTYNGEASGAPEDGTEGDTFRVRAATIEEYGEAAAPYQNGGNFYQVMATLSRGSGAELAEHVPYPTEEEFKAGEEKELYMVEEEYRSHSHYQLKEANILPDILQKADGSSVIDGTAIKQALASNGSVGFDYEANDDTDFIEIEGLDYPTYYVTYQDPEKESNPNHIVQIVGWDDTIPAEAFTSRYGKHPENNGGWLVKNSWGDDYPGRDYFYISYEDEGIYQYCQFIMENTKQDKPAYAYNYQYDGTGMTNAVGLADQPKEAINMANIFTATGTQSLDAVAFYTTDQNAKYSIQVYTGVGKTPVSGSRALSVPQSGAIAYPGYHTVKLDKPVKLSENQRFSVVIQIQNPEGGSYPAAFEMAVGDWNDAKIDAGESFINLGNKKWLDLAEKVDEGYGNICLKALTNDREPDPVKPDNGNSGSSSGGSGSSGSGNGSTAPKDTIASENTQVSTNGSETTTTTTWTDTGSGAQVNTQVTVSSATGKTEQATEVRTTGKGTPSVSGGVVSIETAVPSNLLKNVSAATAENPLKVAISLPASVAAQLQSANVGKAEVSIEIPSALTGSPQISLNSLQFPDEVLSTAKLLGKDLTVNVKNESGAVAYSITLAGAAMQKAAYPVANMNLMATVSRDAKGASVSFRHSGFVPGGSAVVSVPGFTPNSTQYAYYRNAAGAYEELAQTKCTADASGKVSVKIVHCSDYAILSAPAANVYPVKSDTFQPVALEKGKSYTFCFTASNGVKPAISVGNSTVISGKLARVSGNDYYYTVTAAGASGNAAGVYTTVAGGKPVLATIVSVK